MLNFLRTQNISEKLIEDIIHFRNYYKTDSKLLHRVPNPRYHYYGKEVWEMAIVAVLQGENILLSGPKATGKNVLADNLAAVFHRPSWNVSFHVNTDSTALIGTDTFVDGEVKFRRGSIYEAAIYGGFGIFDEINMAKNDAIAVLHAALDHRRIIDVSGYERIDLAEETRFIGTMNYGYAGTKELNEALVSRFMVIDIPPLGKEKLKMILHDEFRELRPEYAESFSRLFMDLQLKSQHAEISSKAVDLRGLIGALRAMKQGLEPTLSIQMGIVNKVFDEFEKEIVEDVVSLHLPRNLRREDIFVK